MRRLMTTVGAGLAIWLVAVPAWTHHAFSAEFDAAKPVKLHGVVTKMEWVNPHSWMHIQVKRPDGKLESGNLHGAQSSYPFNREYMYGEKS